MSTRFETSSGLPQYFKSIDGLSKPLTKDEELELAARIQLGDECALNKLVQANLKFVVTLANKFIGMGVPIDDLIQEGNIGMWTAARKFTPDRGVKFITYAQFYIRKALNNALVDQGKVVRLPMNQEYDLYKQRIAGEDVLPQAVAIDKQVSDEDDTTLGDLILRTDFQDPVEMDEKAALVTKMLGLLKPSEREIVELFYGFTGTGEGDDDGLSTAKIAEMVNKTPAEVNRALKVARARMRKEIGA